MNLIKTDFPIHPFLFGLFPIYLLFFQNVYQDDLNEVILPSLFIVLILILIFGFCYFLKKNLEKPAIILSIAFILDFTYLPLRGLFSCISLFTTPTIGYPEYIAMLYCVFLILCIYFIGKTRRRLTYVTRFFNIISISLILLTILSAIPLLFVQQTSPSNSDKFTGEIVSLNGSLKNCDRDIYYIIVDRYPGSESLQALYQYDNSPFIDNLTERGFTVMNHSRSNYAETVLSLPSSLNMQYLDGPLTDERMAKKIEDNNVMQFLKSQGYSIVFFRSTYVYTNENRYADIEFNDRFVESRNNFQKRLMQNSFFLRMMNRVSNYLFHYQIFYPKTPSINVYTSETLRSLTTVPELPEKKFIFAHIEIPVLINSTDHPQQGTEDTDLEPNVRFTTNEKYTRNLEKFNPILLDTVDKIVEKSKVQPIIIIQSDHGVMYRPGIDDSAFVQQWTYLDSTDYIPNNLNAYYLPDGGDSILYPSITPVNTFRLIFNYYFNTSYEKLDDTTYVRDRTGVREIYWLNST